MDVEKFTTVIAQAAEEKKGSEIIRIEVGKVSVIADYFVLITAQSRPQARAIAASISETAFIEDIPLRHGEGSGEGSWVVQDYGIVIVHIFLPHERNFYQLENFWIQAPRHAWITGEVGDWEETTALPVARRSSELLAEDDWDEEEDEFEV